ncbi:hypothetical protein [Pedobacter sp. JCM 36344]|uniref:hypothetical protein n=1 Tax=Pedobacter sp. JCM 36344 TaxID=3374280 RepID=UPI00397907F4
MKKVSTLFIALLLCTNVMAQSNFYKLSIGGGIGYTHSFTDVQKHDFDLAGYGTLDYYFTPFVSFGGELQKGQIVGGSVQTDPYERQFVNSYTSATVNGKLALGAFINYNRSSFSNFAKYLYVGAGAGVIHNKMRSVARFQESTGYKFPGNDYSNNITFPFDLGLNIYFRSYSGIPRLAVNINLQTNVTVGEGLDGYDDSSVRFKNSNPDIYNYYSVGIKYHFGPVGVSRKSLY